MNLREAIADIIDTMTVGAELRVVPDRSNLLQRRYEIELPSTVIADRILAAGGGRADERRGDRPSANTLDTQSQHDEYTLARAQRRNPHGPIRKDRR